LGADAAVTSVALACARSRFPDAEICLVGPEKNAELFAADPAIKPIPVAYGRSSLLRDRLLAALELQTLVDEPGTIVIDPDSRLTQLGLIPVCDDSRYFFFESRAFGGDSDASLTQLTREWLANTFDAPAAQPYVAPPPQTRIAEIALSLGVGENADKRLSDSFERQALDILLNSRWNVVLDRGAGGEEAERVTALAESFPDRNNLLLHDGSYASFASHIIQSRLYVGYDSVGQHVAAAACVPLVSVFAGFACERMFHRWRPGTPNARIVPVFKTPDHEAEEQALAVISEAVAGLSADRMSHSAS
jgi:ADP-heptose:LPS heptosyltransferase